MDDLKKYGKLLRTYKGSAILHMGDDTEVRCRFQLAQVSDGRLYARCEPEEPDLLKGQKLPAKKLVGRTDDGRKLVFEDLIKVLDTVSSTQQGVSRQVWVYGKHATFNGSTNAHGLLLATFGLTNLMFLGTERYTVRQPNGAMVEGLQTSWHLDGLDVTIRPVDDYRSIVDGLKATRGVDITCEATIELPSLVEVEAAIGVVEKLCLLLTLARGTSVDWLHYDISTDEGTAILSHHRSAITKPFSTLQLIAHNPPQDTGDFISRAYPSLGAAKEIWEFRKAVNAYTYAKAEGDHLEFRGLKMAVVMEHLKACYLNQTDSQCVVEHEMFQSAAKDLVGAVQRVLPSVLPKATRQQITMMANHAQGFNWYPFGRALAELCGDLGLKVNSRERRRFKEIRDELVHRMDFQPEHGPAGEQYFFMMTFVGKILLAILQYGGYYWDWTEPPGWVGPDMEMRVKLDLGT